MYVNFSKDELNAIQDCIDMCCDMTCPIWDDDEELGNNVEIVSRKLAAYLNDTNMGESDIIPLYQIAILTKSYKTDSWYEHHIQCVHLSKSVAMCQADQLNSCLDEEQKLRIKYVVNEVQLCLK